MPLLLLEGNMERIKDKEMARIYLYFLRTEKKTKSKKDSFKDIKRELRRWFHREEPEQRIVRDDYDSYDAVITCPNTVQSYRAAGEYYFEHYYSEFIGSPYDCTGSKETRLRKIFKRNGQFFIWYYAIFDV